MIEITEEYKNIAKEYKKEFGYGVPLSMIPPTTDMTTLLKNIKECLDRKEDVLLEMYGVTYGEDDLL